jgi:diguanylate cyclase (GGDEF)-like protein
MSIAAQTVTVLIADDSPVYRKLVEHALSEHYPLLFAKNGRQAIDLFEQYQPSLVITDWEMPDITGIQLCEHIRSSFQKSYTYIIILTSKRDKDNIVSGLTAGADDYLTKPFHAEELIARVGAGRRVIDLHCQIEVKNRELQELALTDALTGLPNRRAVEEWAAREFAGAIRHSFPFWVAIADLDSFKQVNDVYGHGAGDSVLKTFADILKANTRSCNICGRVGGEEFMLILTHTERQSVQIAVERVRKQLENHKFDFERRTASVTASFGIAGLQGLNVRNLASLVRAADLALYSAKKKGRNRIEFSLIDLHELPSKAATGM